MVTTSGKRYTIKYEEHKLGEILMNDFVYYDKLNEFSRTYLVKGNEYLIKDVRSFKPELNTLKKEIGEKLLYHDGISFKVYGENIPLAVLINLFGIKGIEELLEEKAIEFVLDTSLVTYLKSDCKGVMPLQSGTGEYTSKVFTDTEESVTLGLEWLRDRLTRPVRRSLIKKVLKAYKVTPPNLSKDAVTFGHEGYNSNLFSDFGLPKQKDIMDLNGKERRKLCDLASQCAKLTILSQFEYSSSKSLELMKLNVTELDKLKRVELIEKSTNDIFTLEDIPDFEKLIEDGVINLKDIPKLRKKKNSMKFRKWIDKVSLEEQNNISKEYIDAIVNTKNFWNTNKGQFIKTVGISVLGSEVSGKVGGAIGGMVAGTNGVALGENIANIAGLMTGVGISLLDTYVLGGICKGWTPKFYIENEIRPLIN